MNLTRTIEVTIYCYEINFIGTSKSRALEKPLIVMDQLWHLVRWATLEVTGCCHWVSIQSVLLRRMPRSLISAHTTKVVAVKMAPPKLAAKRHNTDPLLTSSMPQAS